MKKQSALWIFGDVENVKKDFVKKNSWELKQLQKLLECLRLTLMRSGASLFVNFKKGKDKWKLVKLKENFEIKHECLDEQIIPLKVKNFQVEDDKHWSFLIDEYRNQAVEI